MISIDDICIGLRVRLSPEAFKDDRSIIKGVGQESNGVIERIDDPAKPVHFEIRWNSQGTATRLKERYQHWNVCELGLLELSE